MAREMRPVIVAHAKRITGSADEAEDVAQDTLLKLWSMRESLDSYNSLRSLSMVITRNECIDRLRRKGADSLPLDKVEISAGKMAEADSRIKADEYADATNRILDSLPPSWQVVMRMRHVEDMETTEIARLIGSSEQSVRVILSRARKRIKDIFVNSRPYDD